MDGVRTAEGGEGVTGAMIRARIWVAGRLGGGLQAFLRAPMAAYSGSGERDGGIGHGKRRSRTVLARVCGDVGLAGGSVADGRRQAGSGMARSRARARLNCSSQGQRRGRCTVVLGEGYVSSVRQLSEDVTIAGENDGPELEEVSCVFQDITWTYEDGGATHTDSWSGEA